MDANSNVKKLTLLINTIIMFFVLGLLLFFHVYNVTIMIYFSIPTMIVYLLGYVLIFKGSLYLYVCMVYFWLSLYMSLATVCLGPDYGFCLYSLSMIPIIFYINYIAYKLNLRRMKAGIFCSVIILCFLISTGYAAIYGPVYQAAQGAQAVFWVTNSMAVFTFLIIYTRILIRTTIKSEEALKEMSYVDRLTGLYNRHYMMEALSDIDSFAVTDSIAMIDIDDFKKINDVYGHNAGDQVLIKISDIMRSSFKDAVISRWGGEEFLILIKDIPEVVNRLEALRMAVKDSEFIFENEKIDVTITIGCAERGDIHSLDKWVQCADERLYYGKKNGKNAVITVIPA